MSPETTQMCWLSLSALGLAQICSWGTLYYSFPQMAVAMNAELGWLKPEIYLALTIGLLFSALASVPVGIAIDKGYGRTIMSGGSVLAGLLFMAWAQVHSILWFYIIFAGIGFLQAATLYNAAFAVVAKHFDTAPIRHAIATLTLWGGFASTIFIPLIELLMNYIDWRGVLIVLGLVNIFVCGSIYQTLPTSKPITPHDVHQDKKQSKVKPKYSIKWVSLQPVFWALLTSFLLYAAITSSFKFHFYPLLLGKGLSGDNAVFILALLGPAQVAGRVMIKMLASKSIVHIGIIVISLFPLAFAAIVFLPTHLFVLIPATITFGAASGTMTIIKGVAVPEFLTQSSYGAINGILNMPVMIVKALAPTIAAFSWSMTKNYNLLLMTLIMTSVAMLAPFVLAAWLKKRSEKLSSK